MLGTPRYVKDVLSKVAFVMDALHPAASMYPLAAVSLRHHLSAAISPADWKEYMVAAPKGQRSILLLFNWKAEWMCTLTLRLRQSNIDSQNALYQE